MDKRAVTSLASIVFSDMIQSKKKKLLDIKLSKGAVKKYSGMEWKIHF